MSADKHDKLVIQEVKKHYEATNQPFHLADLGIFFRTNEIEIPEGVQFKDYLKVRFQGRLAVVQDPNTPARIAIALFGKRDEVLQRLTGEFEKDSKSVDFNRLPFALVVAFVKSPMPGSRVFFRTSWPFRYTIATNAPLQEFVEIDREFQPSSLRGAQADALSHRDKQKVYEHIEKWAEAKSLDLRTLYYDQSSAHGIDRVGDVDAPLNALQRLVNAQEPDLRDKFRIPSDIASLLTRFP